MKRFLLLFCNVILIQFVIAQSFGIGTDSPDPNAILEVQSSDRGILIPRLTTTERNTNLTGLMLAQRGLLIYNITDDAFNYWNGTQWIAFPSAGGADNDWVDAGAVMYPFDGATQNVSVGSTLSGGKFSVFSTTPATSIYIENDNNTSGATGIGNYLLNASSGGIGIYQEISGGSGTGVQLSGIYNDFTNVTSTGSGIVTGITNNMSGDGSSVVYGVDNRLDGSQTGTRHGVYTSITGTGTGIHYGMFNEISSSSNGQKFGVRNSLTSLTTNYAYGTYNQISGAISTQLYGNVNVINNTGNSTTWGMYNGVQNAGTGTTYGIQNSVGGAGTGAYYGVHNSINTIGVGNTRYGVYNSIGGNQEGIRYGVYNLLFNSNDLNSYGTYNYISTAGIGNKYGTYNYFHTSATGTLHGNYIEMTSTQSGTKYGTYYKSVEGTIGTQVGNFVEMGGTSTNPKFGYYYQSAGTTNGQQRGYSAVVTGSSSATGLMYGYFSTVTTTLGGTHYGVGTGATGAGDYGIFAENLNSSGWAGYFQGDVTVTGTFSNPSDRQFKDKIKPLPTALNAILKLEPKSYIFKPELAEIWGFPKDYQVGLIAQEVEEVLPNLVLNDSHTPRNLEKEIDVTEIADPTKYKSINYIGLIPYLIKSIQEQNEIIQQKDEKITNLENQIKEIEHRLKKIEVHK